MPLRLLLESHRRGQNGLGAVVSAVLHGGAVALIMLAYRNTVPAPSLADRLVTFLVPPDRALGQAAGPDQAWTGTGTGAGGPLNAVPGPSAERGAGTPARSDDSVPRDPAGPAPDPAVDSVLTEFEVDSIVFRYDESAAPDYPAGLLAREIEGSALVSYVVDTNGRATEQSFRVIRTTHPEFARAVREALPGMRFRPALLRGVPVPQLVQQSFAFRIRRDSAGPPPDLETR